MAACTGCPNGSGCSKSILRQQRKRVIMDKTHHYMAFLSHRTVDKDFVFWLQKKLEHYRVGKKIKEAYGLRSKTVSPVCVYEYEFASNRHKEEMAEKIGHSKKMILVCSRASASPVSGGLDWSSDPSMVEDWSADPNSTGWVGYEIDCMLKAGREKDIILVVKDGDPESGDCFHPLIRDQVKNNLKYYDFRAFKKTGRMTFLDLVCAVVGVSNKSEIYDHDAKYKRIRTAGLVSLALAVMGASFWAWSYFLPHTQQFRDYAMINGIPKGIGRLKQSDLSETAEHYLITTTKATHRIELSHVNPSSTPVEETSPAKIDAPMIAVYNCRSNWSPDTVEYRDRNGIVQMTYAYATDMRFVTFQENEYTSEQVYPTTEVNEYGVPVRMKIDRYDLSFDEEGHLIRRMYMSGVNYVIDENGVAGEQYGYDENDRMTSLRYLNRARSVAANRYGVAGCDFLYDESGLLTDTVIVDAAGSPVYGSEWYASVHHSYSGMGQIVESTYYTPDGKETVCSDGYSRMTREYDRRGNVLSERYSGPDQEPLYCAGGYHLARYEYNELGDMISAAYYGENGQPVLHEKGYSSVRWERDAHGNAIKTSYFGTDGSPMPSANYASVIVRSYNDSGYMTEEKNYGVNGAPVITAEGYFRKTIDHDGKNRPVDIRVYGLNDDPVYHSDMYHRMHFDYDDRGNLSCITLYGTSGQLIPFSGYWAVQERQYNGGGQVTAVSFFDQYRKPVVAGGLYASVQNTYDDRGLLTSSSYFDAGGKLMNGLQIIRSGVAVGSRGYAKVEYEYDESGNEIRRTIYDENGEYANTPITEFEYDEVGRCVKKIFRSRDGELTRYYEAIRMLSYDQYGRLVRSACYDAENQPINGIGGFFTREQLRDHRGNILDSMDTDKNGRLIGERILLEYDSRGLEIRRQYVDAEGKPVSNSDGYSMIVIENDAAGRQVRSSVYDTDGNKTEGPNGFCTVEYGFDAGGNTVSTRYFDRNGQPVNTKAGHSGSAAEYNDYRKLTKIEFFDKEGTVLFRYTASYKDYIYPTEEALFGRGGEPIESNGYNISRVVSEYDENNQQTSARYYGKNGRLHLLLYMFAGWSSEYRNGQEISRTYYGTDGKPMMIDTGFASVSMERNELGQEVRRTYFDADGKPVNNIFGFSVMEVEYGSDGEIASSAFFDTEGKQVTPDGRASLESLFMYDSVKEVKVNDPDTGGTLTLHFSEGSYNVRLLAFRASDGTTDQFAQPRYELYDPNVIGEYLYKSARSYIPEIDEDDAGIDISGNENAKDWKDAIAEYVQAVENNDSSAVSAMMDLSSVPGLIKTLTPMVNKPRTAEELTGYYFAFWKNALNEQHGALTEKYGKGFRIAYEILNMEEIGGERLDSINRQLQEYSDTAAEYLGIVSLTVRYTVSGSLGSGMEKESFLTPVLVLFQTENGWTLGTGNGFPNPDTEELVEFFGGLRKQ